MRAHRAESLKVETESLRLGMMRLARMFEDGGRGRILARKFWRPASFRRQGSWGVRGGYSWFKTMYRN